jgi:DNA-binding PadR family transcriptional regulator
MTEIRLGCLAAELLPIICKEPMIAYAYALHTRLVTVHETECSKSDVSRALKFLAAHGVLEAYVDDPTKPRARIFYRPTWLAGFYLVMLTQKWDRPSFR